MAISRCNRYPVSGKQSKYHIKTFHQTTRSMLYIFWNICKIFFKLCNTIPGPNVHSDMEEIKVLGALIFVFGLHCLLVIKVPPNTRDIDRY